MIRVVSRKQMVLPKYQVEQKGSSGWYGISVWMGYQEINGYLGRKGYDPIITGINVDEIYYPAKRASKLFTEYWLNRGPLVSG